jgi:hypothetical protein
MMTSAILVQVERKEMQCGLTKDQREWPVAR